MNTDNKATAVFMRKLAESIRVDTHTRHSLTGRLLEDHANYLDPPAGAELAAPPAAETPPLSAEDEESAKHEKAPIVTRARESHAAKEASHRR